MNLMRQLGGSFGIAVLGTYVTNNTNVHRAALIAHVSPVNPVYQHTLMHITHELQANGLTFIAAQKAAFGLIAQMLDIQTITMSYNDAFLLIGMTCLFVSPTIFLLRNRLPVGTHTVEISE
jgi:DHA2 family multidrug resistance protein